MRFTTLLTTTLLAAASSPAQAATKEFDWDCTNSLGTCNNACYAIYHGLAADTLTYDANKANRNPRRTASGCNRTPCTNTNYKNWGGSCDEYPFASTKQGGAGAVLRCVDSTDNDSEGGQLGNFYKKINDGDKFHVFIKNYKGANFCDNQNAANDGSEFRLSGGAFANAKRRTRRSEFEDAPSSVGVDAGLDDALDLGLDADADVDLDVDDDVEAGVSVDAAPLARRQTFREFEDENGARLLLLSRGTVEGEDEEDMVGRAVFDNGNWTLIRREIV